jgi:mannan endo-1,4-beta-mannosidase
MVFVSKAYRPVSEQIHNRITIMRYPVPKACLLMLMSVWAFCQPLSATRFEAESAVLAGNMTPTADAGASGGSYAAMGDYSGSSLSWNNVEVPSAGSYDLKIGFRPTFGEKRQDLYVNDVFVGQQTYDGSNSTWLELTVSVSLNSGLNTVEIRGNWGWTDFDYIEIDGASAPRLGDTYEAEEATLTAVTAVSDGTASGGEYVFMEAAGSIVWNVTAATADRYTLTIGYRLPFDVKNQVLYVNGSSLGEVVFSGALNEWLEVSQNINLNAGANTIEIRPSWGYIHFDFINLVANPAPPAGDVYEAEDATLTGVTTGTDGAASGGAYVYMEGTGSVLWEQVEVPLAGTYQLTVGFQLPWDTEKYEHLTVNGVELEDIHFTATPATWDEVTVEVTLQAGVNMVEISRNWGWLYLDFIRVAALDTSAPWAANTPIDLNATAETKRLYASLQGLGNRFLFGQANAYSISRLTNKNNQADQSDVKDVTGSHPAFVESDFMWYPDDASFKQWDMDSLRAGYERGAMIGYCWHLRGPLSGDFYKGGADDDLVSRILNNTGGARDWYLGLLDDLVIPVFQDLGFPILFRPFHEMSGGWFWWGKDTCTPTEYKQLWRLTVDHLKAAGVHNLLYVWAAGVNMGAGPGWEADAWDFYPGDAYVDVIATDAYNPGVENWFPTSLFIDNLEILTDEAAARGKVAALSETGAGDYPNGATATYWTESILNPIKSSAKASRIAYVMTWYNNNWGSGDQWAPYAGIPSATAVSDFMDFYADPVTIFEADLPNLYGRSTPDAPLSLVYQREPITTQLSRNCWELNPGGSLEGPLSFEVIGSLPKGLKIEGDCVVGFVPSEGTFRFTVVATGTNGSIRHEFEIRSLIPTKTPLVLGAYLNGVHHPATVLREPGTGTPAETAVMLMSVELGQPLELRFEYDFIKDPVVWMLLDGKLPEGLSMDNRLGVVSGTPTEEGTFLFAVSVKDWRGRGYQWVQLDVMRFP